MAIPVYLAMTASEIGNCSTLPGKICWMACHFSPFGKGISNIPRELPGGSILILDDSYPPQGHCPEEIAQQLGAMAGLFPCHGVILDFQRPGCPETARIASRLAQALPCPVAVSALYAGETQGAVLVPPVPLRVPLHKHLAGWSGREIWLELAMDSEEVKLTRAGAVCTALPGPLAGGRHRDISLHCHYDISLEETQAVFTLGRTREDLDQLMEEGAALGVKKAIGLYQELR